MYLLNATIKRFYTNLYILRKLPQNLKFLWLYSLQQNYFMYSQWQFRYSPTFPFQQVHILLALYPTHALSIWYHFYWKHLIVSGDVPLARPLVLKDYIHSCRDLTQTFYSTLYAQEEEYTSIKHFPLSTQMNCWHVGIPISCTCFDQ